MPKAEDDAESAMSIKTLPPLVRFDLNLESLRTCLEEVHSAINDHAASLTSLHTDIKKKAYERTVGEYFKKISESLHKECGERPVSYKIEEHNFLADHFLTDDSLILKGFAEKFIEKVEVIGLNLIENTKFRK